MDKIEQIERVTQLIADEFNTMDASFISDKILGPTGSRPYSLSEIILYYGKHIRCSRVKKSKTFGELSDDFTDYLDEWNSFKGKLFETLYLIHLFKNLGQKETLTFKNKEKMPSKIDDNLTNKIRYTDSFKGKLSKLEMIPDICLNVDGKTKIIELKATVDPKLDWIHEYASRRIDLQVDELEIVWLNLGKKNPELHINAAEKFGIRFTEYKTSKILVNEDSNWNKLKSGLLTI